MLHHARLSVRPSVLCLRLSRNRKVVEISNLLESQRLTRITSGGANLRQKVKGRGHWNYKNRRFSRTFRRK